jgi:crotonobetaine/carnitine-CoA ligase
VLDHDLVLPHLIAERARTSGEKTFLQHVDGRARTFAGVHAEALRWAGGLRRLGIGVGDRVVAMLPPSFEAVTTWLGIGWLRAVEVPLHTAYRGRMLEYTVNHVRPSVAIVHADYLDRFAEIEDELPGYLQVVVVGETPEGVGLRRGTRLAADVLAGPAAEGLEGPAHHDLASILYTSGTTGPSKGVMVPWAQIHAMSEGCIPTHGLTAADVWYSPYPTYHASGKIPVYAMALLGGTVVMRDRFEGRAFWDDVLTFGCTTTMLIGASAGYIAARQPKADGVVSPLRNVLVSPPPADPEAFEKELGIRICSVFNMTEISAPISTDWRQMTDRTCGQVRAGYECRIVDEHDDELPRGVPGELIVRADKPWVLNAGYWDMAEKTAEAWRNGWFHTGDVCMQDERGEFFFVDRAKDAIRRRGENISSMEVEVTVVEHPAVVECAAFGVAAEYGEEEVKIAVVLAEDATFNAAELIQYLAQRMPRFMVPRYIEVVAALPRTPTEKVRKDQLRAAGITETTWDRDAVGMVLPR